MLNRLEGAYLSALRIFILVAATLALVVAVGGCITAGPFLAQRLGLAAHQEPAGPDLGAYILEKKQTLTSTESTAAPASDTSTYVPDDIRASVQNIGEYFRKHPDDSLPVGWQRALQPALMEMYGKMDVRYAAPYATSLRRLTRQLVISTGKPLTAAQVQELLTWHFGRYQSNATIQQTQEALSGAKAVLSLWVAGYAFMIFIFIVFCFLIVKIERNLRLVRTIHEDREEAA